MNEQHFEESNNKEKLAKKKKERKQTKRKITAVRVVMMMGAIQKSHNQAVNVVLNAITLQSESMGIDSFFGSRLKWPLEEVQGFFFASFFINE